MVSYESKNRLHMQVAFLCKKERKRSLCGQFQQKWAARWQLKDNNGHIDFLLSISGSVRFEMPRTKVIHLIVSRSWSSTRTSNLTSMSCCELYKGGLQNGPQVWKIFTAVAYRFCLNLHEKFSQPGDHFLAHPCSCTSPQPQSRRWTPPAASSGPSRPPATPTRPAPQCSVSAVS